MNIYDLCPTAQKIYLLFQQHSAIKPDERRSMFSLLKASGLLLNPAVILSSFCFMNAFRRILSGEKISEQIPGTIIAILFFFFTCFHFNIWLCRFDSDISSPCLRIIFSTPATNFEGLFLTFHIMKSRSLVDTLKQFPYFFSASLMCSVIPL